jgi:DNA (cytosine-5)-methyltransferase 1
MLSNELDLSFNYQPILYKDIKHGPGKPLDEESQRYEVLLTAKETDKSICDVYVRVGEKARCFTDEIVWDSELLMTITANCTIMRGAEKTYISDQDIISASTFPQDYDFCEQRVAYVCGMSVPPIMIKRIVTRLIESGIFDYKKGDTNGCIH